MTTDESDTTAPTGTDHLHYVVSEDELGEDDRVIVDVDGREVVVVRVDGDLHAFANYCPHQGGPLGTGTITGWMSLPEGGSSVSDLRYDDEQCVVSCPWHGWGFDVETGEHRTQPKYRIPTYDVVVREGDVYLSLE